MSANPQPVTGNLRRGGGAMVETTGLTKSFRDTTALDDVDVSVRPESMYRSRASDRHCRRSPSATRALTLDVGTGSQVVPTEHPVLLSVIWLVVIVTVSATLATRAHQPTD